MWLNYINLHEKSFDNKIKYKDSYLKWAKLKNTVFLLYCAPTEYSRLADPRAQSILWQITPRPFQYVTNQVQTPKILVYKIVWPDMSVRIIKGVIFNYSCLYNKHYQQKQQSWHVNYVTYDTFISKRIITK